MIDRRHRVASGECDYLHSASDEQRFGTNQEGGYMHFCKGRECRVNITVRSGGDDFDLTPDGSSGGLHFGDKRIADERIVGIHQGCKRRRSRKQLVQQAEPFGRESDAKVAYSGGIGAWSIEASGKARLYRVDADGKDDRYRRSAALAASAAAVLTGVTMTATWRRTRSAAIDASRSLWPSAHRYSIATFWPST